MKKLISLLPVIGLILVLIVSCRDDDIFVGVEGNVSKIAFGSCSNQALNFNIYKTIKRHNPDLYIAMGDNVYLDPFGTNYNWIQLQYDLYYGHPEFKYIKDNIPTIATWDDHDYGENNGGVNFSNKQGAKNLFMKFWDVPENSPMRTRDGVYESYYYGDENHKLQIILLDTRWNLDIISGEPISPTSDVTKDILGEAQWTWLEQELLKPADVRIIGTSTQFCIEENGYEAWANYPHEMERMFDLIRSTQAENLFFISGDIHYAELSKREETDLYPIYDLTSSGLTHHELHAQKNKYREGRPFTNLNFGIIDIKWGDEISTPNGRTTNAVEVDLTVYNRANTPVIQKTIPMSELTF